jgi:hypothetical protein
MNPKIPLTRHVLDMPVHKISHRERALRALRTVHGVYPSEHAVDGAKNGCLCRHEASDLGHVGNQPCTPSPSRKRRGQ